MDIYDVLNYLMFIGLLPISFFWLRRAYKIGIKKDYSFVALKRGVPPDNPKKYAKYSLAINLIAGLVLAGLFIFIIVSGIIEYYAKWASTELVGSKFLIIITTGIYSNYETWTSIVGTTIWLKIIFDFITSRQAHFKVKKK